MPTTLKEIRRKLLQHQAYKLDDAELNKLCDMLDYAIRDEESQERYERDLEKRIMQSGTIAGEITYPLPTERIYDGS